MYTVEIKRPGGYFSPLTKATKSLERAQMLLNRYSKRQPTGTELRISNQK